MERECNAIKQPAMRGLHLLVSAKFTLLLPA